MSYPITQPVPSGSLPPLHHATPANSQVSNLVDDGAPGLYSSAKDPLSTLAKPVQ